VNDEHEASIADFGLARILEATGFTTKSVGGTCRWMAYELIAPSDNDEDESVPRVTLATDIWAFGMTALEVGSSISHAAACLTRVHLCQIFTGELPFFHIKFDTAVMLAVMKGGRPTRERYPAITLISGLCWNNVGTWILLRDLRWKHCLYFRPLLA